MGDIDLQRWLEWQMKLLVVVWSSPLEFKLGRREAGSYRYQLA
jgi:hypothetical protein